MGSSHLITGYCPAWNYYIYHDTQVFGQRSVLISPLYFPPDAAEGKTRDECESDGANFSRVVLADAISPFLSQEDARRVTLAWVPGHEGVSGNEAADKLAKGGVRRAPSLPVSMSRTRARRDSSDRLLSDWRAQWLATVRRDSFAPANRIAPSTRPTPHLRALDKAAFSHLLQCRTGHAFTGEYLRAINKPERSFACTCGVPLQTRDHLLVGCPELERFRAPLYSVSPQLVVADLLGTKEGIAATAKFLIASKAFSKPADEDAAPSED